MIDYLVMWIHQRVGENTAISAPLWAYVLGVLALAGLVPEFIGAVWASPAAIGIIALLAALGLLVWVLRRGVTKNEREHKRLAAMERAEFERFDRANAEAARVADLQRLQAKYPTKP